MRVLVPLAARRSHRVIVDSQAHRADVRRHLHVPADRLDVVPLGIGVYGRRRSRTRAWRCASATDSARVGSCCRCRRSARTRTSSGCSRRSQRSRPIGARSSSSPATRRRTSAGCANAPATLGVLDDVRLLDWVSGPELEGLYALADVFVLPVAARGLRPAGARGDAARRAGRVLRRELTARGRRRRRAALRPRRPARDHGRRSSACSAIRRRHSDCESRARRRPHSSHGRRRRARRL